MPPPPTILYEKSYSTTFDRLTLGKQFAEIHDLNV